MANRMCYMLVLAVLQLATAQLWAPNSEEDGWSPALQGVEVIGMAQEINFIATVKNRENEDEQAVSGSRYLHANGYKTQKDKEDHAAKQSNKDNHLREDDISKDANERHGHAENHDDNGISQIEESKHGDSSEHKEEGVRHTKNADGGLDGGKVEQKARQNHKDGQAMSDESEDSKARVQSDHGQEEKGDASGGMIRTKAAGRDNKNRHEDDANEQVKPRGTGDKKEEEIAQQVLKHDLVTTVIHPSRLMPFYMLPVAGSGKILMQFLLMGFEIKMKPQDPDKGCGKQLLSLILHMAGTLPLIFLTVNSWMCDWKDFQEVDKHLPRASENDENRTLLRMVIAVTSPNFLASIGVWGSIMAQSPKTFLGLKPRYMQIPVLRGFPLNPFGTTWLRPLKWCLAMMLAPYAIWALPGYFVLIFLQCQLNCSLCCCNGIAGFFCVTWNCFKCCCCFSFWKCFFWMVLAAVTLGLWAHARQHFTAYFPMICIFGQLFALQLWCFLIPYIFAGLYACLTCANPSHVADIAIAQQAAAALGEVKYAGVPQQESMDSESPAEKVIDNYVSTNCVMCCPWAVPQVPLEDDVKLSMKTFDAFNLNKDFEIEADIIAQQRVVFQDSSSHQSDVDKAKLVAIMCVLKAGTQVVMTQIVFLCLLRISLFMQGAMKSADPWTALTMLPTFWAAAYRTTMSERHWYDYLHFLKVSAAASLSHLPRTVNTFWTLL